MRVAACLVLAFLLGTFAVAQQSEPASPTANDNTKTNRRDRNDAAVTADQQKENKSDRELAKQIRRALVKDKSLSTYAHNIKVIAESGNVTLKGPVRSEEEKQAIEAKAKQVAGSSANIDDQLEVQPKH